MHELIEALPHTLQVSFLLDTSFLVYCFEKNKIHQLISFCTTNRVGMTTFNLAELNHIHHRLPGTLKHHIRQFLKQRYIYAVPVPVNPGDATSETRYVQSVNPLILRIIPDPSDAVLFALAEKIRADIITRDRHHIFTAAANNTGRIQVHNDLA